MKTLTSKNSVQIKVKDKQQKNNTLKDLSNPKPNNELLQALKEGEDIIEEIRKGKRSGHNNVKEMFSDIINDKSIY